MQKEASQASFLLIISALILLAILKESIATKINQS